MKYAFVWQTANNEEASSMDEKEPYPNDDTPQDDEAVIPPHTEKAGDDGGE